MIFSCYGKSIWNTSFISYGALLQTLQAKAIAWVVCTAGLGICTLNPKYIYKALVREKHTGRCFENKPGDGYSIDLIIFFNWKPF